MMQLHQDYDKFKNRDTEIVAVGPEDADKFKKYWDKNDFHFYGIPDPKHEVSDLYGQKVNLLKLGRMPAQILVDKEGYLRYLHYGSSMKDIVQNEDVFKIIDSL